MIIKKQDLLLAQFASLLDNDSNSQHDNEGDSLDNVFDYDDDNDDDDDKSYINNKCKNGHSNKNYKSLIIHLPAYSFITRWYQKTR